MKPTTFNGYYSTVITILHLWITFISIQVSVDYVYPIRFLSDEWESIVQSSQLNSYFTVKKIISDDVSLILNDPQHHLNKFTLSHQFSKMMMMMKKFIAFLRYLFVLCATINCNPTHNRTLYAFAFFKKNKLHHSHLNMQIYKYWVEVNSTCWHTIINVFFFKAEWTKIIGNFNGTCLAKFYQFLKSIVFAIHFLKIYVYKY